MGGWRGWRVRVGLLVGVVGLVWCGLVGVAWGVGGPRLLLHVVVAPSAGFSPVDSVECFSGGRTNPDEFDEAGPCDQYDVIVTDVGSVAARGPVVISDRVPLGLRVGAAMMLHSTPGGMEEFKECEILASKGESKTLVVCEAAGGMVPDERLELAVRVRVPGGTAGGVMNVAEVSEAGSVVGQEETPDVVNAGDEKVGFGPTGLLSLISGEDGLADVQAGGHPYELVNEFDLATQMGRGPETARLTATAAGGGVRDVVVQLPLGFVGSAQATPKCSLAQMQSVSGCPADTMVGRIESEPSLSVDVASPVFNLVPERGVAAELGFIDSVNGTHVIDATLAPSPAGYVLRAVAHETPDLLLWDVVTTVWGDPAAKNGGAGTPAAMFTNSSDCGGEGQRSTVYLDSWQHPGTFYPGGEPDVEGAGWESASSEGPPVTGCEALRFSPEVFSVQPQTSVADEATGLSFELRVAQSETPGTLATPPLRDSTVTLPAGMVTNPAAAPVLAGCSEQQIGWLGKDAPNGEAAPNEGLANFSPEAPSCPEASRIATVEATTPLLEAPLTGVLYLANENENPFGSLLAGYIVFDDPALGLDVKVPGELSLDPSTGQVTGVFKDAPQAPVEDLKIRFYGGTPGELVTPEACGSYTTTGQLRPWSTPESQPGVQISSSFQITQDCSPGFAPAFMAGTTSPQAGSYSPFTLTFSRQDDEQELSGLTVTLPPGLTAKIAGVAKCPETDIQQAIARASATEEINSPSCPAASEIGSVQATAGAGTDPMSLSGKAYLTGPYKGAPLGLVTVVPVLTGPFDLGNVVVRAALYINPTDAHVTAVSDPFPTIVDHTADNGATDGFPARIRQITLTLNRAGYILNPTSCTPNTITALFTSTTNTTNTKTARFQVAGCGELAFKPSFTASTTGHASKADGASLDVHVTTTPGQANIAKVKTVLPKQLPSRLSTIQKACLAATFEANPAACPEGSLIGTATATTPLIQTPFTGPAYLVSHGAAKFPDVEIVLQSENITLILDGQTDIKKGITTSTFETLPDAPVTTFNLNLPTGPHSALATDIPEKLHYNLCTQTLNMPTTITSQNNTTIQQTTHITTTNCPTKKHKHTKHKKTKHKHTK